MDSQRESKDEKRQMEKTLQPDKTMNTPLLPSELQLCAAKILIIDDEETYIRALEWALRRAAFSNFRSLTDSTRARDEFNRFQPDLVLLDWHMPKLDGFAVLKQLRESEPPGEFLPVLVLTGDNTSEVRSQALKAGATDFLGKPIDHTEVTLRIKNLLQTRILHRQAREIQTQLETLTAAKEAGPQTKPGQKR
jgi:putative two-component system response regulator